METDADTRRRRATEEADEPNQAKHPRRTEDGEEVVQNNEDTAGKVKKIRLHNFMCHDALEISLNENVNFIVGHNGSGKSAILTALTVGLGARENVTSRGTSINEFIKKGRNSATIEITLVNIGDNAYKPDIYGDTITVIRTIEATSSYKIKNWRGEIISTKRDELDSIITTMNIQIDNPISVLNQDVLRTFLVTSKPDEKYNLFMKATLLDAIENNYKEALYICEEEYNNLKQYYAVLSQIKGDIQKLKERIHTLEEMGESQTELSNLEMELQRATAITEENKLRKIQENLKMYKNNLEKLQNVELSIGTDEDEESDTKIQDIKQKDVDLLKKKIQKLESCNDEEHNKREGMIKQLSKLEERLDELEASLCIKQTEIMLLEVDKMRLMREVQCAKTQNFNRYINRLKRDLSAVEEQSVNALSVFGSNIPRLLKRIEEECKNNRFKEKPRGPIGAFIKMKDAAWAPAVENFFGYRFLSSFCVDNSQDAKLLNSIMKEIFHNENTPQIITSKFFNQVLDVRRHCTQSPCYSNLLEAMVIEDPVVANCLIDQREIECVLLIPTVQEACMIMSDMTNVPRNCKRAFTLLGDTFYPDPNYRTYGGRCCERAKYLQVSIEEMHTFNNLIQFGVENFIQQFHPSVYVTENLMQRTYINFLCKTLKKELQIAENMKQEEVAAYNAACEKVNHTTSELSNATATACKLRSTQSVGTNLINELKDKIRFGSNEATSIDVFSHIERVKYRQKMFLQLRDFCSDCLQKSFTDVFSLSQYKGTVVIDHVNKTLDLHVSARDDKKSGNDIRSLSGGERSYLTVAFILALWKCIQLPFYFLDEFDVLCMDKVNRQVIIKILLDHTRLHPQSQFVFLTPLDMSHILDEDYVTIHQLQPDRRENSKSGDSGERRTLSQ